MHDLERELLRQIWLHQKELDAVKPPTKSWDGFSRWKLRLSRDLGPLFSPLWVGATTESERAQVRRRLSNLEIMGLLTRSGEFGRLDRCKLTPQGEAWIVVELAATKEGTDAANESGHVPIPQSEGLTDDH